MFKLIRQIWCSKKYLKNTSMEELESRYNVTGLIRHVLIQITCMRSIWTQERQLWSKLTVSIGKIISPYYYYFFIFSELNIIFVCRYISKIYLPNCYAEKYIALLYICITSVYYLSRGCYWRLQVRVWFPCRRHHHLQPTTTIVRNVLYTRFR